MFLRDSQFRIDRFTHVNSFVKLKDPDGFDLTKSSDTLVAMKKTNGSDRRKRGGALRLVATVATLAPVSNTVRAIKNRLPPIADRQIVIIRRDV